MLIKFFCFLCFSDSKIHQKDANYHRTGKFSNYNSRNVSDVLKLLLENYDMRLRPNFGGNAN